MKESTLAKITASVSVAKGMAQKALAASPNPQWTEYEMQSVDEWIARQDVKLNRSEAIRRLGSVEIQDSQIGMFVIQAPKGVWHAPIRFDRCPVGKDGAVLFG
jgi:hypothetical protein